MATSGPGMGVVHVVDADHACAVGVGREREARMPVLGAR